MTKLDSILSKKNPTIGDVFEILKTIVSEVSAIRTALDRLPEVEQRIDSLVVENEQLKKRICAIERKSKENNLIIFNLPNDESRSLPDVACSFFSETLDVSLQRQDVVDCYRIGGSTTNKKPILVKLQNVETKHRILKNLYKLRNNVEKINVDNDLIPEDRVERRALLRTRWELSEVGVRSRVRGLYLIVDNKKYNFKDIESNNNFIQDIVNETQKSHDIQDEGFARGTNDCERSALFGDVLSGASITGAGSQRRMGPSLRSKGGKQ